MAVQRRKRKLDTTAASTEPNNSKKCKDMPVGYTAAQKSAIQSFGALTNLDKAAAAKVLKQHNWDVQSAANSHFSGANAAATSPHAAKLNKLFDTYRDNPTEDPDEISMEGTMKLLEALDVNIESVDMLVFSELVGCPTLGTVTREGFVTGFSQAGVSDPAKMAALVASRRSALQSDSEVLKRVYKHTFPLARAPGQKAVLLDMAVEYWRVLFSSPSWAWSSPSTPWLDWWLTFLTEKYQRSVNKDLWDQTLVFARRTVDEEQLGFWSEDSAWPAVIDDFVAYVKERRGTTGRDETMDTS